MGRTDVTLLKIFLSYKAIFQTTEEKLIEWKLLL
jgi:hypothetical protein